MMMPDNLPIIIMNNLDNSFEAHGRTQQSLALAFRQAVSQQSAHFKSIGGKCTLMQDSIAALQRSIQALQDRLHGLAGIDESMRIQQLKAKQREFIISELQEKLKRVQASEDIANAALMSKQSQVYELQYRVEDLQAENNQLKQQLAKKVKQIRQLVRQNSALQVPQIGRQSIPSKNSLQVSLKSLYDRSREQEQVDLRDRQYGEIEARLREMEDVLNSEIEYHKKRNVKLEDEVRLLKTEAGKQATSTRRVYELELKIKNLETESRELQASYTEQMALNNENEIKFHKRLNQLRIQLQQQKKNNKLLCKQFQKQIRKFAAAVLGANSKSTIFIGASTTNEQLGQLAKEIVKEHKKQLTRLANTKDIAIEELKLNAQTLGNKIKELTLSMEKIKSAKSDRVSQKATAVNGHNTTNRSGNSKTQLQKQTVKNIRNIEKAEQTIQSLKAQIQHKDRQIQQMRRSNDLQQNKMTDKILGLQSELAQKQMQIKYQEQKYAELTANMEQADRNAKGDRERETEKLKGRMRELQAQREEMKVKYKEADEKAYGKEKVVRQMQRREKELVEKIKKIEKRTQAKLSDHKKQLDSKDKAMEQLIKKNQNLHMELKLLTEKNKITELSANNVKPSQDPDTPTFSPITLKRQFLAEKQELYNQVKEKQEAVERIKAELQQRESSLQNKDHKISELSLQISKLDNDLKLARHQNQRLKQSENRLKSSRAQQTSNNFSQLKQQYEKREKIIRSEAEKIVLEQKAIRKQAQNKAKKLSDEIVDLKNEQAIIRQERASFQEQKLKFSSQKFKDSQRQIRLIKSHEEQTKSLKKQIQDLQSQLSQLSSPTPVPTPAPRLYKGTESIEYVEASTNTPVIASICTGINTVDIFSMQAQSQHTNNILDFNDAPNLQQQVRNSNLFVNLNQNPPDDDVFEICDENEEVNFGQGTAMLELREIFNALRVEIEKLFNLEQVSTALSKMLPVNLQDDYYEFMGYLKEKIQEIKQHNEISFIKAEPGYEPEPLDDSLELPEAFRRQSQGQSLRRILSQKEALISSLMNEKTQQQNTINQLTMQKQQIEQQNQNRFMNQCNVYKKQIKQHKKQIDLFEMNFQSMKNVIRNVLEAYSTDEDMEDDFRESMTLYARVAKLTERERSRINFYIEHYLRLKGLDTN